MKTPHVWIIEMLENGRWTPCASASLTKYYAKLDKKWYEEGNPDYKFRIRKYVRESDKQCHWQEDDDGVQETECGNAFILNDGGVSDNGFKFCPYCGRAIVVA